MYQGDVLLCQTENNGDIEVVGGEVTLTTGLDTAIAISVLGGNFTDDTTSSSTDSWWGNEGEDGSRSVRSATEHYISTHEANTGNVEGLIDAVVKDLQWLRDEGLASEVEADVMLLSLDKAVVCVTITTEGEKQDFQYTINWSS